MPGRIVQPKSAFLLIQTVSIPHCPAHGGSGDEDDGDDDDGDSDGLLTSEDLLETFGERRGTLRNGQAAAEAKNDN